MHPDCNFTFSLAWWGFRMSEHVKGARKNEHQTVYVYMLHVYTVLLLLPYRFCCTFFESKLVA